MTAIFTASPPYKNHSGRRGSEKFSSSQVLVCSKAADRIARAPAGQDLTQAQQWIQAAGSPTVKSAGDTMPIGHTAAHLPQPAQFSLGSGDQTAPGFRSL